MSIYQLSHAFCTIFGKGIVRDKIDVVYFDATTLYFESFKEDEFKKNGYSKESLAN